MVLKTERNHGIHKDVYRYLNSGIGGGVGRALSASPDTSIDFFQFSYFLNVSFRFSAKRG